MDLKITASLLLVSLSGLSRLFQSKPKEWLGTQLTLRADYRILVAPQHPTCPNNPITASSILSNLVVSTTNATSQTTSSSPRDSNQILDLINSLAAIGMIKVPLIRGRMANTKDPKTTICIPSTPCSSMVALMTSKDPKTT